MTNCKEALEYYERKEKRQPKRIPTKLEIKSFLITFEYVTWKGNHRKTDQRMVKHINSEEAKKVFKKAAEHFRTMFNVSILNIKEMAGDNQVIDL